MGCTMYDSLTDIYSLPVSAEVTLTSFSPSVKLLLKTSE